MRVGLSGGIASGKSTVSSRLAHNGAKIIDYDLLSHQVLEAGGSGVQPVLDRFGQDCADKSGGVDRSILASRVFGSEGSAQARLDLDSIIHPLVFSLAAQTESPWLHLPLIVVHDIPLLAEVYETIPFTFEHVIVVEAPDETRIARMVKQRHMTHKQAVDRMSSQVPEKDRLRLADIRIDGSQPIEQMFDSVDRIYADFMSQLDHPC